MNETNEIRMKFNPKKLGIWLFYLVGSNSIVEMLKLPCMKIIKDYPDLASWMLALFLTATVALIIFIGYNSIEKLRTKRKLKNEESRTKELIDMQKEEDRINRLRHR